MGELQAFVIVVFVVANRRLVKLIIILDVWLVSLGFNVKLEYALVPLLSMIWVENLQIGYPNCALLFQRLSS